MSADPKLTLILKGCKDGNEESFSQLLDIFAGRCYGYFYRLTGNAEVSNDLLGELFVKLVEKIDSFRGGTFEAWLFRIASNIFYDYLRARKLQEKITEKVRQQFEQLPTNEKYSDNPLLDTLQPQLDKLDVETREIILFRFYSGLSFREIAEICGQPIGTVISKVHRGLKKLRILMEQTRDGNNVK